MRVGLFLKTAKEIHETTVHSGEVKAQAVRGEGVHKDELARSHVKCGTPGGVHAGRGELAGSMFGGKLMAAS